MKSGNTLHAAVRPNYILAELRIWKYPGPINKLTGNTNVLIISLLHNPLRNVEWLSIPKCGIVENEFSNVCPVTAAMKVSESLSSQ